METLQRRETVVGEIEEDKAFQYLEGGREEGGGGEEGGGRKEGGGEEGGGEEGGRRDLREGGIGGWRRERGRRRTVC